MSEKVYWVNEILLNLDYFWRNPENLFNGNLQYYFILSRLVRVGLMVELLHHVW